MSKREIELKLAISTLASTCRHLEAALQEMSPFSVDATATREELSGLHDARRRIERVAAPATA